MVKVVYKDYCNTSKIFISNCHYAGTDSRMNKEDELIWDIEDLSLKLYELGDKLSQTKDKNIRVDLTKRMRIVDTMLEPRVTGLRDM